MHGFFQIKAPSSNIDPSPRGAKEYLRGTITQQLQLFDRSIDRWKLLPQHQRLSDAIVGRTRQNTNELASNGAMRCLVGYRVIDLCEAMRVAHPSRRFFLVTLISDRWLSFDRDTYLWLGGMQKAIRPVMAIGRFDGWFGMVEIQTLDETERGLGRILLPNFHAVAWSDDPSFSPEKAEAFMAASKRLVSRIGAPTVDVSFRADTSPCNLAAYIMKAACVAKRREPCRGTPSGLKLSDTSLQPVSAVRQLEVLSMIYFDELMLSGGNGTYLRRELKSFIKANAFTKAFSEVSTEQAARHWSRIRRGVRCQEDYAPVAVDRSANQLPYDSPITLACTRFNPPPQQTLHC